MLEISIITILPTIMLGVFIYLKDRKEKEPFGLLSLLILCGIAAFIISHFIKIGISDILSSMFRNKISIGLNGEMKADSNIILAIYNFLCIFIGIALSEEVVKFVLLFFVTNKNKNYDYMFDAIVYSCFLAIGFSVAQMLYYGFADGWDTVLIRALATLPLNVMYSVITGVVYTIWHSNYVAYSLEKKLKQQRKIKKMYIKNKKYLLPISVVLPMMLHTVLSLMDISGNIICRIIMYSMIFVVYVLCFIAINRFSQKDEKNTEIAKTSILRKHPELVEIGDEYEL